MRLRYWILIFIVCAIVFVASLLLKGPGEITIPFGVASLLSFNFIIRRCWGGFRVLFNIFIVGALVFLFFQYKSR